MDTSTYHYKSRRREQAGIEARIREICETRVRYGYRRVHVLLRREGWEIRVLTVVDTFSRFSPVLDPRFSYRGEDVVQTL